MALNRPPEAIHIDSIDLPALPPGGERAFRRALAEALVARSTGCDTGLDRPHRRDQPLAQAVRSALAQIDAVGALSGRGDER